MPMFRFAVLTPVGSLHFLSFSHLNSFHSTSVWGVLNFIVQVLVTQRKQGEESWQHGVLGGSPSFSRLFVVICPTPLRSSPLFTLSGPTL